MYLSSDLRDALPDDLDPSSIQGTITVDGEYGATLRQLALVRHPGGLSAFGRGDFLAPFTPLDLAGPPRLDGDDWRSTLHVHLIDGDAHAFPVSSLQLEELQGLLADASVAPPAPAATFRGEIPSG